MSKYAQILVIAIMMGGLSACSGDQASPPCDSLKQDIDPAVRADLEKRCPRSGPDFKPSPKKEY